MGRAVAPLRPACIVQSGLGAGDAGAFEEHDQVVVAVGGAEYPVVAVRGPGLRACSIKLCLADAQGPRSPCRSGHRVPGGFRVAVARSHASVLAAPFTCATTAAWLPIPGTAMVSASQRYGHFRPSKSHPHRRNKRD